MVDLDRLVDEIEPNRAANRFQLAADEWIGKFRRHEQSASKHCRVRNGRPCPGVSEGAGETHAVRPEAHVLCDLDCLLLLQVGSAVDREDGAVSEAGETEQLAPYQS